MNIKKYLIEKHLQEDANYPDIDEILRECRRVCGEDAPTAREVWIDGELGTMPERNGKEKLSFAIKKLNNFWNTPLRGFWKNVYFCYKKNSPDNTPAA